MTPRDLLGRRPEQNHRVGSGKPRQRAEGEFALARPELDFQRAQRHAERCDAAPDRLQRRIDLIEPRFGQILIALIEQRHFGRARRPRRIFRREPRIFQLEEMKFNFEPGEEIETLRRKPRQRVAQDLPRRERHRLAVGEKDIAEQPAGIGRAVILRPRQHLKRCRVGDHDEIAAALHFRHVEAAAGGEHRIDGFVRGVLGKERRRHGDAARHRAQRVGGHQSLAAQHAVLVGKREAHQFELVALDLLRDGLGLPRLFGGPETVTLDETCGGSISRRHCCGEWGVASRRMKCTRVFAIRHFPFANSSFSCPAGACWCSANSPANPRPDRCRRRKPGR